MTVRTSPTRRNKSKPHPAKRASTRPGTVAATGDSSDVTRLATQLLKKVHALNEERGEARIPSYFIRTPAWKGIAKAPPQVQAAVFVQAIRELGAVRKGIKKNPRFALRGMLHHERGFSFARMTLLGQLVRKLPPLTESDWETVLTELGRFEIILADDFGFLRSLAGYLKRYAAKHGLTPTMSALVERLIKALSDPPTTGFQESRVISTLRQASFQRR